MNNRKTTRHERVRPACALQAATQRTFNQPLRVLTATALLAILSMPLMAQDNVGDESTIVYPASYFDEWQPITAQDMLIRIPGQEATTPFGPGGNPSSGGRGLGAGGGALEILINGKRVAGKNNSTSDTLSRISAEQVQEFQIIRGTSGDLDVRGSGQIVNVILSEEMSSSSIAFQAGMQQRWDGATNPVGNLSYVGQSGKLDYVISLSSQPRYRHSVGFENSVLGDFSLNDIVREEFTVDQTENQISTNIDYAINDRSSLRMNALYATNDNPTEVNRYTTDLTVTPNSFTIEREDNPGERDNWEIGGDYEYTTAGGGRFKLLAIANQDNRLFNRNQFLTQPDGNEQQNLYLLTDSTTEERIVRSSYTMDIFTGQSLEFGIERAQTTLESSLALGVLRAGGISSPAVGGLTPVPVSNANSTVEEIRYEPFAIHNWQLNSKTSLESTLVFETSEITQVGDVRNSRDFEFWKPKVDLRYDLTPQIQVRGSIERIVNQLSFSDFVASNSDEDNDQNTFAGNASLRQQTQWRYEVNADYRLPNDVGVLSAQFFYADHQDVIDRVDVTVNENNLLSANGNVGDGSEYGTNLTASIRMGMIGLPELLVTSTLNLQDSSVNPPFVDRDVRFQFYQRGRFTLITRHDIPEWRVNWGIQYFDRIDGGMYRYDIDDIEFTVGEPRLNFFVEHRDRRGITYRFDYGNITNNSQCRRRTRFVGRTTDNVLEEIEFRCTDSGEELGFQVTGTF